MNETAYAIAQRALADLKSAVYLVLKEGPREGLRNADIGRLLGIYGGHVRHQGHIPRVILTFMQTEGVVRQDREKRWLIRKHPDAKG
jgi:hypothetical protein